LHATSEDMLSLGTLSGFADSMGNDDDDKHDDDNNNNNNTLHWMLTGANGKGFWDILTLFVFFENF